MHCLCLNLMMIVSGEPGQPGLPGRPGEPGVGMSTTFRFDGFLQKYYKENLP